MSSISPLPNILFLDIDDVLMGDCPKNDVLEKKLHELFPDKPDYRCKYCLCTFEDQSTLSHFFSTEAVGSLHSLIERVNNLKIVVSSSWRQNRNVKTLQEILKVHSFSQHIIDRTPDLPFPSNRGREIAAWRKQNPEHNQYVILDDWDHGLSVHHPHNFVEVDAAKLLTEADCEKAYKILTSKDALRLES